MRWSLKILILKSIWTIIFIFIIIFAMFQPMHSSVGVLFQTQEPTQNFELKTLFNSGGVGFNCSISINHNWVQVLSHISSPVFFLPVVRIEPATSRWFHLKFISQTPRFVMLRILLDNTERIFETYRPNDINTMHYYHVWVFTLTHIAIFLI